ncbi:MAG: hypothetical protein LBP55_00605 [Candidatus Adiutrix sp.]|jgi:predicted RNA-binding Zn-ribbon protein involved in translation (DUF1610 family)|nr:hypothetical protein [Candidatus Adiutrix sp.]
MTDSASDAQSAPECMHEETTLIEGVCPECGKELEFFSVNELRNQKTCYHCKKAFDTKAFAAKAGVSI